MASFLVWYPFCKYQPTKIDGKRLIHVETTKHTRHALIVDDKPLVREMVSTYLGIEGYTFETAANGQEGLAKFNAGKFDLVITDRIMPDMDGAQLASAIKHISPNTPIIMLTATPPTDTPADVDIVLEKPVTLATFSNAIRTLVPA